MHYDNTYITVDLDAIEENFHAIQEKAGVPIMAVVKADAYGHGAVAVARLLRGKCGFFGVSSMQEALELRRAGIQDPILILGQTPVAAFPYAVKEDIRPTIFRYEDAKALSEEACRQGKTAAFHLAVDTGMGRIGFQVSEKSADICAAITKLPNLHAEGIFSHYATADCEDLESARQQAALFEEFLAMLSRRGVQIPLRHMDNSAGIMNFSGHYDMVRAGIVLYGMYPSRFMDETLLPLRPAMQWLSRVTHVKTLEAGRPISYGGTYVTSQPTRVATVSVGYADGYFRNLSGRFYVLIHGKKAPILGRICMDQLMVDVTDIPDCAPEDPVVLIGTDGNETITAEQIAQAANSINYEIACSFSRRVCRIYYQGGQQVGSVRYLQD